MVKGLKSLERKLTRTIPQRVQKETQKAMEKYASQIVAMMKQLAPKGDTRALVNSIGWTWGDAPAGSFSVGTVGGRKYDTMRITIYAGNAQTMVDGRSQQFQNAILQEFGTEDMPPSPYFFVSWRTFRRRTKAGITRGIKKGIKDGAR